MLTSWKARLSLGHANCWSFLHEIFGKEEPAAMFSSIASMRAAPKCGARSGLVRCRMHAQRFTSEPTARHNCPALVDVWAAWLGGRIGQKGGCAQCAHPGLRIGSYRWRTGPDSVCFGGSPVFAGAGTRFESHLGHSVSAGQGPFSAFFVWTVSTLSPLIGCSGCVGSRKRLIRLCGGAFGYGGPGASSRGSLLGVHPRSSFRRVLHSLIHGGQGRSQHDLLNIL
ncbi:hypothetical protein BJG92_03601 [Arthrobacter sp. SO5]|nr:hypothetical protein [Arthrobacter sp. SO5]